LRPALPGPLRRPAPDSTLRACVCAAALRVLALHRLAMAQEPDQLVPGGRSVRLRARSLRRVPHRHRTTSRRSARSAGTGFHLATHLHSADCPRPLVDSPRALESKVSKAVVGDYSKNMRCLPLLALLATGCLADDTARGFPPG